MNPIILLLITVFAIGVSLCLLMHKMKKLDAELQQYGDSLGISRERQAHLKNRVDACVKGKITTDALLNDYQKENNKMIEIIETKR